MYKFATIHKTLLASLFCVTACRLAAQYECSIKHFNVKNGLPQNSIIHMTMGYNGYLWLGTQNGLIRFNGRDFKTFLFENTTKQGRNDVRYLVNLPADKKLVFGTGDGLAYAVEAGKPVLQKEIVRPAYSDNISGYFSDLAVYKLFNKSIADHPAEQHWNPSGIQLLKVKEKDFIIGYGGKPLLFYYNNGNTQKEIALNFNFQSFLASQQYRFIQDDQSNLYLFDTTGYGFKKVNIDWHALKTTAGNSRDLVFYPDQSSGETWCLHNTVFYRVRFNPVLNLLSFVPEFSIKEKGHAWTGLVYDSVSATFFLSTLTEGIYQVKQKKIHTYNLTAELPTGLDAGFLVSYVVLKTSDSTAVTTPGIEFTTASSGIKLKKLGNLSGNREAIGLLPNGDILCGQVSSLYYYSRAEHFLTRHVYNDSFNRTNNVMISTIHPEGDSVWVATGNALYCFTPKKTRILYSKKSTDSVDYGALRFLYRSGADEVLVANEKNLFRLKTSYASIQAERFPAMSDKWVRHISSYKNVLILSVYRHGLYILKAGVFYKVPLDDKQDELSTCHSTYIDSSGYIWITTNKGLYKSTAASVVESALHPGTSPFYFVYDEEDGIDNTEFNGGTVPNYAVLKNQQLFYPSMGGIVQFKPGDLNDKMNTAPVRVEKVLIDNKGMELLTDSINLQPDFRYLVLEPEVSNFSDPKNLSLEYNLDSTGWKSPPIADKRRITLVNIAAGTHRLLIRKRTGFGISDFTYTSLSIHRKKHIYEQLWFYPAVVLLTALIIWLFLQLKTANLKRNRAILQKQVDEQTAELSKSVEAKDLLINIIAQDMMTPLRHISLIAEVLRKGLEKDPQKTNDALLDIKTTSDRLLAGSGSIVEWMKYNSEKIQLEKKPVPLGDFIDGILDEYIPGASSKRIYLHNEVPEQAVINIDQTIFAIILNNIISNAVKWTKKGGVRIYLDHPDAASSTVLIISDTGLGMSEEALQVVRSVLKGDLQAIKSTTKINTGLGYVLISELAKIHQLSVTVDSALDKGTTVYVTIAQL